MNILPAATFLAGSVAVAVLALAATARSAPDFIARIEREAIEARNANGGQGVSMSFTTANGWLTRHPALSGGQGLSSAVRARTAAAIAAVPGVGGVSWRGSRGASGNAVQALGERPTLHCQRDVEAILRVRTIRFAEASAQLDQASDRVLNEVASAASSP